MATHVETSSARARFGTLPGVRSSLLPRPRLIPGTLDEMERCCRSLESKKAQGDVRGMATCCLQIGDLFLVRGDAELAEEMYRRALSLSRILSGAADADERSSV